MEQQQKILTFWDHLEELRHVLFRIAVAVVFLMLVAFLFKDELFAIVRHYKIFCVNGNTGFRNESRIFYFIHLQNEEAYERKESSSA